MVGYAWDTVQRRNPVGFFGMVFVLEGASVALALNAADQIQRSLSLPARAMTYLRSHGQLDREHIHHLARDTRSSRGLARPRRCDALRAGHVPLVRQRIQRAR